MRRGLIGEHLGHSYSKRIHEVLGGYAYDLIEVRPCDLDAFIKNKDFAALNVTIPYKKTVIPYLDELDERARRIGAVNTIVNDHGKLTGYNTDAYGFRFMLESAGITIRGRKVMMLGNGGAAQAVQAVLQELGAREIIKVKQSPSSETLTYEQAYRDHPDTQVIVNTSPVGMSPDRDGIPIDFTCFNQLESVADVIYNPHRTRLIVEAQARGCQTAGGLVMLVAQAAEAIRLFAGKQITEAEILNLSAELARETMNLVLIGMPGSGKSTLANWLGKLSGRPVVDSDQEIIRRIGMPIRDYFNQAGEDSFRSIEEEVIQELTGLSGQIIATGGGVVKREVNVRRLRQSGKVVFLDRPLELLETDASRPLSPNRKALEKLAQERSGLYQKAADFRVLNEGSVQQTAEKIWTAWLQSK